MPRLLIRTLTAAVAASAAVAAPALAQGGGGGAPTAQPTPPPPPPPKLVVDKPTKKLQIAEGQGGRLMLGGVWYFRQDDLFVGERQRFFAQRSLAGWSRVSIPHNWNGTDTTQNRSSVGWYRKEFRLPRGPRRHWKARFESVNHRSVVYLNGRRIGGSQAGYLPFEVDLKGLRRGRNRLVVKVSTLRSRNDLTHWRPAKFNGFGTGGWWNFGGISREVYLRPANAVDIEDVWITPRIRCPRCSATVGITTRVRNVAKKRRRVRLAVDVKGPGGYRQRVVLRPFDVDPNARREARSRVRIARPRLWQPGRPALYSASVGAATNLDRGRVASYRTRFGVKHIRTSRGRVYLNGRKLNVRGASVHEDESATGAALRPGQRALIVRRLRQLGTTMTRAHYPLHPAFLEAFDRLGILYWSQAPVYQVPTRNMANRAVRANAVRANRQTVARDKNHASILVWSIANELPDEESGTQGAFIRQAASAVRRLDRTRLVAIDRQSQLGQPDPAPALRTLDVLGVNEYFGWYGASLRPDPARRGSFIPSGTGDLAGFLDLQYRVYRKPLFITEFGAESTHSGPTDRKGTFEFQRQWMSDHQRIHASKPFVNGSIAWILKDFRVHPTWSGGNPNQATPPWNNKGLIDENGAQKPAFFEMQKQWRATRPLR